MLNKDEKNYLKTLKRLFNSPDGITVLKYWKEANFDPTVVVPGDPYATHVQIGRKEFVQECMQQVNMEILDEPIKIEEE